MTRLPYADPEKASPKVRETFSRLEPLNIFRMLLHADSCFRGFVHLGAALLTRTSLPATVRELAILRVASRSQASYEWTQHAAIARQCGIPGKKVEAIRTGLIDQGDFDETEAAALRFTDELMDRVRASDERLAAVTRMLSDRQVVELVLTVGYYMMVARLLETTGVELEPGAGHGSLLG